MTDPLARYLRPDWQTNPEDEDDEDPLKRYLNPNWMSDNAAPDFDARLNTARGRRTVEAETIHRQIEMLKRVLPAAEGERKERLTRQLADLEREASPLAGAQIWGERGKRFVAGAVGGPVKMFSFATDLVAAIGQQTVERGLNATGVTKLLPNFAKQPFTRLRNRLWETEAGLDELTGAKGWESIAGSFVTPFGLAGAGTVFRSVPYVGKAFQIANAPSHMYAEMANNTLRFFGKAKMLEGAARAGLEGSRLARMTGSVVGDLPVNVIQALTIPDANVDDVLTTLALGTAGAAAGGLLSPKIPFDKPVRRVGDPGDFGTHGPKGPADPAAAHMAEQAQKINQWQQANPGKHWSDLSAHEKATILGEIGTDVVLWKGPDGGQSGPRPSGSSPEDKATILRRYLLGEIDDYHIARDAFQDLAESGLDARSLAAMLDMDIQMGPEGIVMTTRDGRTPPVERLLLASGQAPPALEAAALGQIDAAQQRIDRLEALNKKLRDDLRAARGERRAAVREAEADILIPEMPGQRAWLKLASSFDDDAKTWIAKFDINNFKTLNDALGQEAGNSAIQAVGRIVLANADHHGVRAFRVGGDEFTLAGPRNKVFAARRDIENQLFGFDFQGQTISMSGGVGRTFAAAENNLKPRKHAAKVKLGQPTTRVEGAELNGLRQLSDEDFLANWQAAVDQNHQALPQYEAVARERGLHLQANPEIGLVEQIWEGVDTRQWTLDELHKKIDLLQNAPPEILRGLDDVFAQTQNPTIKDNLTLLIRAVGGTVPDPSTMPVKQPEMARENTISRPGGVTDTPGTIGPQTGDLKALPAPHSWDWEGGDMLIASKQGPVQKVKIPAGLLHPRDINEALTLAHDLDTPAAKYIPPQTKLFKLAVYTASQYGMINPKDVSLIVHHGQINKASPKAQALIKSLMHQLIPAMEVSLGHKGLKAELPAATIPKEDRPPLGFAGRGGMKHILTQEPGTGHWRVSDMLSDGTPIGHTMLQSVETFDEAVEVLRRSGLQPIHELPDIAAKRQRWDELMLKLRHAEVYDDSWKAIKREAVEIFDDLLERNALTKADFTISPRRKDLKPPTIESLRERMEAARQSTEPAPPARSLPSPTGEPSVARPLSPAPLEPVLEVGKPKKPFSDLTRDELIDLLDEIVTPFEQVKNPIGPEYDAVLRDVNKIQARLAELSAKPVESSFAVDAKTSPERLDALMSRPLNKMSESELTELNVLLQNHNAKLPKGDQRKDAIIDKLLELRDFQAAKAEQEALARRIAPEDQKPRGGKRKKKDEGFTLPETQATIVGSGTGFILGMALPSDSEIERARNAVLGAVIGGTGVAGTFYLKNLRMAAKQANKPKMPGQDNIDKVMETTFNQALQEGLTPEGMVGRIVGSMERFYQRTLRPSLTGESVARMLALGSKVGRDVADMLSTFGYHKRLVVEWVFHGPKVNGPDGQPVRRTTIRGDGTPAQVYSAAEIIQFVDGDIEHLGRTALALSALEQYTKTGKMPHPDLNPLLASSYLANIDKKYIEAARMMRDLHLGLLDLMGEVGIVTAEARAKMASEQFYTALERLFPDEYDALGKNIASKIKGIFSPNPVKARIGPNEHKIRNPYESLMLAIPRVMKAVELQDKKASLIALWEASNVPLEVRQSFMRPMTKTQKESAADLRWREKIDMLQEYLPKLSQQEAAAMIAAYDPAPLGPKSDFMTYIRNGEVEIWRLAPDLVDTFAYMQGFEIEKIWKFLGVGSNIARQGTALSPDFVSRIAWFDVFQTFLNSRYGDARSYMPGVNYAEAMYQIWKKSPEYLNFMGGAAEASMLEGIHRPSDMIRRAQSMGDNYASTILKEVKELHPVDAYKTLLTPFAEAGRFSEFLAARRHGASVHEAHRAAAAVAGYYNQAGRYLHGMFSAVPFMKGVAQSVDQAIYASGMHPFRSYDNKRMSQALRWWTRGIAAIGAPTAAIYAINADDDEIASIRKTEYGKRMWFFRNPATGKIFSVRKAAGPEGVFFGATVEAALDAWRGEDPEAFRRWANYMKQEFQVPWLPPAVQAVGTLVTGVDLSFGSPMISERVRGMPTDMMANTNTSQTARTMSKGIVGAFGEPESQMLQRGFSPAGIEYIGRTLGGSLTQEAFRLSDIARRWVDEGNVPVAQEWPVIRKFVSVDMTRQQTVEIEDFYRYARRAEKIARGIGAAENAGDLEMFMNLSERYGGEIHAAQQLLQTRTEIADLWRAIEELRSMPGGDSRTKRDLIQELRRAISFQAGIALDMYRQASP